MKKKKSQTTAAILIYSSTKRKPLITKDPEVHELGQVKIPLPPDNDYVVVEFSFSTNIFTVYAYPEHKRNQKKQCRVEYL